MARLRKALADLRERLSANQLRLKRAQRRFQARRRDAYIHHNKGVRCDEKADRLRAEGREERAARVVRRGQRFHRRAYKQHQRAQWWLGRIKLLQRRIHRIEQRVEVIEAEIKREQKVKIDVPGNKVTGGTPKARFRQTALKSVALCSSGQRPNFYSQPGTYTVDKVFTGERPGQRSDCSQWITSVCKAAGFDDPNGTDWGWGYTGTLVGQHGGWKLVPEAEMRRKGWGMVIYGSGTGYHVEAYIGPGNRTAGHGSAPIDFGVIDLFGRRDYRCYAWYPPKK